MRILLISFHFPSDASPEASRASKLARFLLSRGHDVRILCSGDGADRAVSFDFEGSRILRTPSYAQMTAHGDKTIRGRFARLYGRGRRGTDIGRQWCRPAITTAMELFETWLPDVIYATCLPHSTARVAAHLSRVTDIPFVTDYRERSVSGVEAKLPERRKQLDIQSEREVLNRAAAIVAVSPVWAENYANRYGGERVTIAMDGFDPEHYPLISPVESDQDRTTLRLLYDLPADGAPGNLITLFKGIAALGDGAKDIRVTLVGENCDTALEMASQERVQKQVDLVLPESRDHQIARQYNADALILAIRNDPADAGTIPSVLFDYIGSRRPVIAMGYSKGAAAQIVRKRDLGVFTNEPKVIANKLASLLAKKRAVGVVPFLPEAVRENACMASQFSGLETMLYSVVGTAPLSVAAE